MWSYRRGSKHRMSINVEPEYVDLHILQKEDKGWYSFERQEIAVPSCVVCDAIFSLRSQQTIESIEEIGYLKDGSICKLDSILTHNIKCEICCK